MESVGYKMLAMDLSKNHLTQIHTVAIINKILDTKDSGKR